MKKLQAAVALFLLACGAGRAEAQLSTRAPLGPSASGRIVAAASGQPVAGARVTLFTGNLSFFRETRSGANGTFAFASVPAGGYQLGVAALGFGYEEVALALSGGSTFTAFALEPETELGAWSVIGNTLPELFDATDIAILRPNGTVMYCHDTVDPVIFDPVTGQKIFPAGSGSEQGCMNASLLEDGSALLVGGQNPSSPSSFTNAVPWVKRVHPNNLFVQQGDMLLAVGRWYPGLARLADGRLLVQGGGTSPSAQRTDTCEIYTPSTQSWAFTDTMNSALEFPPCALLENGKVLRSWGIAPELYDPQSGQWQPTGAFTFPNRGFPGHSDHSLIVLSDGRALAVGVDPLAQPAATMTELYDPAAGQWSPGTSPSLVRFQSEVVYLPDGRVLAAGGDQGTTAGGEPNVLGIVKRCDLLEPVSGSWRRVADLLEYREYHAVTLLVPDGRVLTTGGTRIKFQYGPTSANIEAYSPPYLFRGVRPALANLSDSTPSRGQTISFTIFPGTTLTKVVLMGVQSTTHWVDGGIPRRLELPPSQIGSNGQVTIPADPNLAPLGWYLLFALVDDIPSKALFLRVDP